MKKLFFVSLTTIMFSTLTAIFLFSVVNHYCFDLTKQSSLYFIKLLGQAKASISPDNRLNMVILGLDYRDDQLEKTQTTDTIILASISRGRISLVSLPRDLWDYQLSQKINQFYPLSQALADPYSFIQTNYSRLTGLPLDRTLVITTDNLQSLIAITGPIPIYLDQGFTDSQYPNPEYISQPSPTIPIYKTVSFPSGWVSLNSSNITEFVRSRKSIDGGTDLARIHRQQQAIDAIISKVTSPLFIANPVNLGRLYVFWHSQVNTNLTDSDLASLLVNNLSSIKNLEINKIEIPVGDAPNKGLIYHPLSFKYPSWVFLPTDSDYQALQLFINQSLL